MRNNEASNPQWPLIALGAIAVHQVQSMVFDPRERSFRLGVLASEAGIVASLLLPNRAHRWRGAAWSLLALGPLAGAIVGHLVPIARGKPVPSASESALLNLGGAALLLTMGIAQIRQSSATSGGGARD